MSGPPAMQRILVVDDEPPIRRFLRASLSAQGYQVFEADDGPSARIALQRNAIDVLVLDLGLPGADGFEIIKQLREAGSALPIRSNRMRQASKMRATPASLPRSVARDRASSPARALSSTSQATTPRRWLCVRLWR